MYQVICRIPTSSWTNSMDLELKRRHLTDCCNKRMTILKCMHQTIQQSSSPTSPSLSTLSASRQTNPPSDSTIIFININIFMNIICVATNKFTKWLNSHLHQHLHQRYQRCDKKVYFAGLLIMVHDVILVDKSKDLFNFCHITIM